MVKAGEGAWTKAELKEVLDQLNEQREHSLAMIAAQSSELTGLMRDPGDGAGQDQADMGATSFERDHELTVLNSERDKLHQIDRALARIDDGTYGICESCGEPIGKMRLMAFPACHTVHDMQAARGTSLSHDDSSLTDTPSVPSRARVRVLLFAVFAVLYAVDQVTKWLAVDRLTGKPDKELRRRPADAAPDPQRGRRVQHRHAATPCCSAAWRSWPCWSCSGSAGGSATSAWAIAFGLLLAGIAGNLTDRLVRAPGVLRGHVVDFLMLPHWPIFNVADMCINVAAALILVQAFRGIRLDGSRIARHTDDPSDS